VTALLPVEEGEVWALLESDGSLRFTLLVTKVRSRTLEAATADVVVLDASEEALERFRAGVGQTTSWFFNAREDEWKRLRRLS
jgi:hypothetical protein